MKYIIYLHDQYVVVYEALSEALTVSNTGIEKDTHILLLNIITIGLDTN
jgi:hypothetical protein